MQDAYPLIILASGIATIFAMIPVLSMNAFIALIPSPILVGFQGMAKSPQK
jgi:hypothetical protein